MAIGSSVYQPTTVSYEPRPGSLLSQTTAVSPLQVLRKPIPQLILATLSLLTIALGKYTKFNILNLTQYVMNVFVFRYRIDCERKRRL